jgi:hypothetical protein
MVNLQCILVHQAMTVRSLFLDICLCCLANMCTLSECIPHNCMMLFLQVQEFSMQETMQ